MPPKKMAERIYQRYKQFNMDKDFNSEWVITDDYVTKRLSLAYVSGKQDLSEAFEDKDEYTYWKFVENHIIEL